MSFKYFTRLLSLLLFINLPLLWQLIVMSLLYNGERPQCKCQFFIQLRTKLLRRSQTHTTIDKCQKFLPQNHWYQNLNQNINQIIKCFSSTTRTLLYLLAISSLSLYLCWWFFLQVWVKLNVYLNLLEYRISGIKL